MTKKDAEDLKIKGKVLLKSAFQFTNKDAGIDKRYVCTDIVINHQNNEYSVEAVFKSTRGGIWNWDVQKLLDIHKSQLQ